MSKVYDIVNEKIADLLNQGVVPWRRPWSAAGLPRNLVSQRPYRGINTFLLSASMYESPYWLTMKQANQLGGNVRAGERSTPVVFWKVYDAPAAIDDDAADAPVEDSRRRFVLRYYRVWNLAQCELPAAALAELPALPTRAFEQIEAAERIVTAMPRPPRITYGGDRAYYRPVLDAITLPARERLTSDAEFYATLFHELAHSTGHASRLARDTVAQAAPFGSAVYSKEELVAEMGAAYLCAEAGISPPVIGNQAAYIDAWLKRLHDDRTLLVHAAAAGQKASDYILARQAENAAAPLALAA